MSEFVAFIDSISKIVGFGAVAIGAIGAMIQYVINSRAEDRLRSIALLESDIKVSGVFSELVQVANGYSAWSAPQPEVIEFVAKNFPPELMHQMLMADPRSVGTLFAGSIIPQPTPLARQLAAAESIANLAIKYPILLEPALIGLDVTVGLSPFAKVPYERICKYYNLDRPLTQWGTDWQGLTSRRDMARATEQSRSSSSDVRAG